jgi:hypothetical protein
MVIRFNVLLKVHEKVREFAVWSQGTNGVPMTTRRMGFDMSQERDRRRETSQRRSADTG